MAAAEPPSRSLKDTQQDADLEALVGYNLKRAYVIIQTDFRKALGRDGLGPRAFAALSLVAQFPNITQSELARRLGIERSGLVAIVDDLEARAYLQRTNVPNDRRVQALVATDTGHEAYTTALKAVRDHEARLLQDFSPEESQTLIALLKKIRIKEEKE